MTNQQADWTDKKVREILDKMAAVLVDDTNELFELSKENEEIKKIVLTMQCRFDDYAKMCRHTIDKTREIKND